MANTIEAKNNINITKSKYSGKKWCLIHIGNDITYGLAFVAGELLRMNHKIMWLDGDDDIEKLELGNIVPMDLLITTKEFGRI